MARLQLINRGFEGRVVALRLGVNRLGRHPDADFQIDDPTVSRIHCELVLGGHELRVRDCDSSNGTFLDGEPIQEAVLKTGQVLRLGDVECLVEEAEVRVSIPVIERPQPRPPRILDTGRVCCEKHEETAATHQCPKCKAVLCAQCVTRLRRRGGKYLELCPRCSNPVKRIGPEVVKKRSFIDFLKTIKIPFAKRDAKRGEPVEPAP